VPEFIDPVFRKTSPKRLFSVIQNERFGLVFAKTGFIISSKGKCYVHRAIKSKFLKISKMAFLPIPAGGDVVTGRSKNIYSWA
jgi:hypothetical protein